VAAVAVWPVGIGAPPEPQTVIMTLASSPGNIKVLITVPLGMVTVPPAMVTVQRDGRAKRDHDFGVHRTAPKS